jgi:hypothetical protein
MPATIDQWLLDANGNPDPFTHVDFSSSRLDEIDPDLTLDPHPVLEPEVVRQPVAPSSDPEPPPPPPDESPETVEFDGGTATLEKEKGQWKLTVVGSAGGNPQVYWGKTKNELLLSSLAKAQINATNKIREQNKQIKLGSPVKTVPTPPPVPLPINRVLSADEIFEIKTQLGDNPDLAMENWFQKKTGLTLQQLVSTTQQSAEKSTYALAQMQAESATKSFIENNPDYYPDPQWENFKSIVRWISKFKLSEIVKKGEENATFDRLVATGNWTVESIEEAFEDLSSDDLLVKLPKPPRTPPVPSSEPEPAPRPTNERIVRTETRPRAALGLRSSDVTPVAPPSTENAPSAEDLDSLSDAQIKALYQGVRRQKVQGRRSN